MEGLTPFETQATWAVLAIALVSIVYALVLRGMLSRQDSGTEQMQEIGGWIKAGTSAYLSKQTGTIVLFIILLTLAMAASVMILPPTRAAVIQFGNIEQALLWTAVGRGGACLVGALFALMIYNIGAHTATVGNLRTVAAARKGYNPALQAAYRASTMDALLTVGLGLLGGTIVFITFGIASPYALIGFAAGASLVALFARVGGGICATATDASKSLVSPDVPENDPRNTAVVASAVGNNVNDSAGAATDAFGTFEIAFLAAIVPGVLLADAAQGVVNDGLYDMRYIAFPVMLRGIGVLAALIGNSIVRTSDRQRNAMAAMRRGVLFTALLAAAGFAALSWFYLYDPITGVVDWRPGAAAAVGLALAIVLDILITQLTSTRHRPVKELGRISGSGPAASIMTGMGLGFYTSVWAAVATAVAALASLLIYAEEPLITQLPAMLYGIALVGLGVLTPMGNFIAINSFGAVVSGARSIGQLASLEKNPRNILEDLEIAGNTTGTVTRTIAISSAIIAIVALAGAFLLSVAEAQVQFGLLPLTGINLIKPSVLIGLLIGGALPLLFSSLTLRMAARAIAPIAENIRQQFTTSASTGDSAAPDYAQTMRISAMASRKHIMSSPGLVALLVPALVAFALGVEALGSFLGGLILSGLLVAVVQTGAAGAWDNARRYIEDGFHGGKNSVAHRATLAADTSGSALKHAAGVSLLPTLKASALIALIIAPIAAVVRLPGQPLGTSTLIALGVGLIVLLWSMSLAGSEVRIVDKPPRRSKPEEEEELEEEELEEEEDFEEPELEPEALSEEPAEPEPERPVPQEPELEPEALSEERIAREEPEPAPAPEQKPPEERRSSRRTARRERRGRSKGDGN